MTTALFQEPTSQPDPETPEPDDVPSAEAPYGWTTDPVTGERRPKKTAGRRRRTDQPPKTPGVPPALEELKAQQQAENRKPAEDVAPAHQHKRGGLRLKAPSAAPKPPEPVPPFRAGPIAKGVNKLYRRAGKIVKVWDREVGSAIIACTVKDEDDEDDITVGEAWEELARTNPRVRAFLTKMITAGAFSTLFTAHAPILMALMLKDGIRARIPLLRLADAFLVDDEDDAGAEGAFPSGLAQMMGGIGPEDVAQMMGMLNAQMGAMANGVPRSMNDARDDG